jgi:hypothetical protein
MPLLLGAALVRIRRTALIFTLLCSSILYFSILCSSIALAKDYEWKDAKVIDISSQRGKAAVVPIAALVGMPVTKTFYWIQTDETVYVIGPAVNKLWKVTLHEATKVAIDGNYAHILDDYGRDKKMPIVEKVARPKPEHAR